jgi:hypothetical protein
VTRIDREAVEPDVWKIAAIFLKFLRTVVTLPAQTLKWTQPELVHVASLPRVAIVSSGAEAMPIFIDIVARAQSLTRTQAHGRGQAFRQFTNRVQCGLHRDDIAVRPKARDYSCNRCREL